VGECRLHEKSFDRSPMSNVPTSHCQGFDVMTSDIRVDDGSRRARPELILYRLGAATQGGQVNDESAQKDSRMGAQSLLIGGEKTRIKLERRKILEQQMSRQNCDLRMSQNHIQNRRFRVGSQFLCLMMTGRSPQNQQSPALNTRSRI
jgi:hypothetical protein